jgi:hypothetical protein
MKKSHIYLLFILLILFAENTFCQKVAEQCFFGIAKSYLEYSVKNYKLDSSTVFIVTIGNQKQGSDFYKKGAVFYDITFDHDYSMFNYEYDNVYKLGDYKLIIKKGSDTALFAKIFEPGIYENLNKGQNNGFTREDFHWWHLIFNTKCEVTYLDIKSVNENIKLLKSNNVRFAKKFWSLDANGLPKSYLN